MPGVHPSLEAQKAPNGMMVPCVYTCDGHCCRREMRSGGLALDYQRTSHNRLLWKFWCFVWPYVLKVLSIVTLALSLLILWCDITMAFDNDNLSPLSQLVHSVHGDFIDQVCSCARFLHITPLPSAGASGWIGSRYIRFSLSYTILGR